MKKYSVVQSLRQREVCGTTSKYDIPRYGKSRSRVFCTIPSRLAFPLKQIVSEHVLLEEGHVFLGFGSDGMHVVSYTETFESFNQAPTASFLYRLHWWKFRHRKQMVKLRSISLFANEEILHNLKLSYVEWPNEKSKIVAYGICKKSGNCYITVTSVPPKQPCTDCDSQSPGCLVHSFVAHMKYSTVSTLSPVLSPDGMKIDDLMILNMGHSIGVISLGLLHKNNAEGLPLSSIKHATFEDRPTEDLSSKIIEFSQPSDNCDMTDESHSVQFSESFNLECGSSQELFSSQNTSEPESVPSQCFTMEYCSCPNDNPNDIDPYFDPEPKSIVLQSRKSESEPQIDENCCCMLATSSVCSVHHNKHCDARKHCETSNISNKKFCSYCGYKIRAKSDIFLQPQIKSPKTVSKHRVLMRNLDENFFELNGEVISSPSASESSGSIYCVGENASQSSARSGNCRRTDGIVTFFETFYGATKGLLNQFEQSSGDDNNLFCGPVTFHGVKGAQLNPVGTDRTRHPETYSQHLVLDIEHVIFDVLRTRCYTTYKFGYLIDYDVQIVDTCSSTRSVTIFVVALLNVTPRKGKKLPDHFNVIKTRKSQQFQFFLCWTLQTGRYEVVAAAPLSPYCEKTCGKWNVGWIVDSKQAIRRSCAVPLSRHRCVHVLNNATVFKGVSLSLLWDTNHFIALRR